MRYLLLSSALLLAGFVTVASAESPKRTVYLDHVVLEDLKKSNPERYAKVHSVMAAASELCKPNAGRLWAAANAPASCSSLFLKTSYPPKREIGFQIDDTWYVANVIVRDGPVLQKAEPGQVIPAGTLK